MPLSRDDVAGLIATHCQNFSITDGPKFKPDVKDGQEVPLSDGDLAFRANAIAAWQEALNDLGATKAESLKACRRAMRQPTRFWADQLAIVLKALEEERGANLAQGHVAPPQVDERAAAEAASRDCEHCHGTGWCEVYHRQYSDAKGRDYDAYVVVRNSDGPESRLRARYRLACVCPLGRWLIAANLRSASFPKYAGLEAEAIRRRCRAMDGLQKVLDGGTDYQTNDPTLVHAPHVRYGDDWRTIAQKWAATKGVELNIPNEPSRRPEEAPA